AVWAHYGVLLSGAADVPINPALSESDIRTCIGIAKPRRVVTTRSAARCFQNLGLEIFCAEDVGEADFDQASFSPLAADAVARIAFTSGTTGLPKGAVHDQEGRWITNVLLRASLPHTPDENSHLLLMTPFSHGSSLMTMAYHGGGATV